MNLNLLNKDQVIYVIENQIVNRQQAQEITKQSTPAFSQSVRLGYIKPIIKYGDGKGAYSFFYRQEIEEYARNKKRSKVEQRLSTSNN